MKKLEISQMEKFEGGIDCSTGLGLSTGLVVGGALLMGTGLGAGLGVYLIGSASFMLSGGNCADAF
ncbi:hypothetical protein GO491_03265 [Flavobacteriaceae bacterium Ap0902]|nr:hypothetical protein [Flavobacteriaceae bacterium Ap0902]